MTDTIEINLRALSESQRTSLGKRKITASPRSGQIHLRYATRQINQW